MVSTNGAAPTNGQKKYVVKLRLKGSNPKFSTTVLSLDGGGMRGLVAAVAAAKVEQALSDRVTSILLKLKHGGADVLNAAANKYELFVKQEGSKELDQQDLAAFVQALPDDGDFKCITHLCDYFDVMAGTSTGSILASYFATRGGTAHDSLLRPAYDGQYAMECDSQALLKQYMAKEHVDDFNGLEEGSAQAAQAIFVSMGYKIFGKPSWVPEKLSGLLVQAANALGPKHKAEPISEILRKALGDNSPIKFQCDVGGGQPAGRLHTCLMVPTLQTDQNRAVLFWAAPKRGPMRDAMHGYAVVHYPTRVATQQAVQEEHIVVNAEPAPKRMRMALHAPSPAPEAAMLTAPEAAAANGDTTIIGQDLSQALQMPKPAGITPWLNAEKPATGSQMLKSGIFSVIMHDGYAYDLWQVVRASTAAPTFFPAQKIDLLPNCEGMFVDGGMVANNPAQQAIAFALMLEDVRRVGAQAAASSAQDQIAVLSIGCGQSLSDLRVSQGAGLMEWAGHLSEVLLGSAQDTATATSLQMLNRIFPPEPNCPPRLLRVQCTTFADGKITDAEAQLPVSGLQKSALGANWKFAQGLTSADAKKALTTMDDPKQWEVLLQIGKEMAAEYEQDITRWVNTYVLPYDAYDA